MTNCSLPRRLERQRGPDLNRMTKKPHERIREASPDEHQDPAIAAYVAGDTREILSRHPVNHVRSGGRWIGVCLRGQHQLADGLRHSLVPRVAHTG